MCVAQVGVHLANSTSLKFMKHIENIFIVDPYEINGMYFDACNTTFPTNKQENLSETNYQILLSSDFHPPIQQPDTSLSILGG